MPRLKADNLPQLKQLIRFLMINKLGKSDTSCDLCGKATPNGADVHHTKYEKATLYDLMFVCRKCNCATENKYLE